MQFSREQPAIYAVRKYDAETVWVNDQPLRGSVAIAPQQIVHAFSCEQVASLSTGHLQPLLDTNPEVIILAVGDSVVFPPAAVMREVQRQGIGIEVMNDGAAVRTYNVLLSEERAVVLALVR
ncbi:MAG: MTH938/NDUFAF3 family protein [Pseudomonadota bacterium]